MFVCMSGSFFGRECLGAVPGPPAFSSLALRGNIPAHSPTLPPPYP